MLVETEITDQRLADKCRIRIAFSIFLVLQYKMNGSLKLPLKEKRLIKDMETT